MAGTIRGGKELSRRLHNVADGRALLRQLQIDVVGEAKRRTVPFRKTGNLGRSIRPGFLSDREAYVKAEASYALFVEQGTGLYGPRHKPIVPKRARTLAWRTGAVALSGRSRVSRGAELGGWAFAKSVKGRPATPFLEPGAKAAARKNGLKETVVELWNEGA